MKFLDTSWQQSQLEPELTHALQAVLSDGQFINGPAVGTFEEDFAKYVNVQFCVGCANGTDALELVLEGFDIGEGDDVIVPAMTFVATSEAVIRSRSRPILVDVDHAAVLDFGKAIEALTPETRAIIIVHLYGFPADVQRLRQMLDSEGRQDVLIVEDAAQGHGASRRHQMVGSLGDAASFSFYPGKNLGAFGDEGAITTSFPTFAERVRRLADHGRLDKYDHEFVGRNSRMDSLQGAVLKLKLRHLDRWIASRHQVANMYFDGLADLGWIKLPAVPEDGIHAWHQFAAEVPNRDGLRQHLHALGIPSGIHYPQCLPDFKFHADSPKAKFPRAAALAANEISLPIAEHLTESEVERVIEGLVSFKPET